jgi:hypothetical protein
MIGNISLKNSQMSREFFFSRKFFIALLLIVLPNTVLAKSVIVISDQAPMIEEANRALEAGEYSAAIGAFQRIETTGTVNADLFYNLGTAYLKSGDLGHGILYLQKALKVNPWHGDARANLAWAVEKRTDVVVSDEGATLSLTWLLDRLPASFLTVAMLILHGLFLICLVGLLFIRKRRWIVVTLSLLFLTLDVLAGGIRHFKIQRLGERYGVIVAHETELKEGPSIRLNTIRTLHEGLKVRLGAPSEEWIGVQLENNVRGHILIKHLEEI